MSDSIKATFYVVDTTQPKQDNLELMNKGKLITQYDITCLDMLELKVQYQMARCVWSEFMVEVHTDRVNMSNSHTYQYEVLNSLR